MYVAGGVFSSLCGMLAPLEYSTLPSCLVTACQIENSLHIPCEADELTCYCQGSPNHVLSSIIDIKAVLQVVDTAAFAKSGAKITDFDVNNLKLSPKGLEIKMTAGVPAQGQDLDSILQHIRAKTLLILHRPPRMERIDKMQNRGWQILSS